MPRPKLDESQKKQKITITLSPDLYKKIQDNRDVINVSAIAEDALRRHFIVSQLHG